MIFFFFSGKSIVHSSWSHLSSIIFGLWLSTGTGFTVLRSRCGMNLARVFSQHPLPSHSSLSLLFHKKPLRIFTHYSFYHGDICLYQNMQWTWMKFGTCFWKGLFIWYMYSQCITTVTILAEKKFSFLYLKSIVTGEDMQITVLSQGQFEYI